MINGHPEFVVNSMSVIFGEDFLDNCRFQRGYDNNLVVRWSITLCNTAKFFSYCYYLSLLIPIDIDLGDNCISDSYINSFATWLDAKFEQANIHYVAFYQHYLSVDQQ